MEEKKKCGIVMPISEMSDFYTESYWEEVLEEIEDAIKEAGLESFPVWEHSDGEIIQSNILQNLISTDIVVVDVSGYNANVFFELGVRFTSSKPVIIISDEKTDVKFDVNYLKHVGYCSNLKSKEMKDFKKRLGAEIKRAVGTIDNENHIPPITALTKFVMPAVKEEKLEWFDYLEDLMSNNNVKLIREIGSMIGRRVPPRGFVSGKYRDEEHLLNGITQEEIEFYENFRNSIEHNLNKVKVSPQQDYVSFKTVTRSDKGRSVRNFADIQIQGKGLKIWLNQPFGIIDDPFRMIKDVSDIGHLGNGDCEMRLPYDSSDVAIGAALQAIMDSHKNIANS